MGLNNPHLARINFTRLLFLRVALVITDLHDIAFVKMSFMDEKINNK